MSRQREGTKADCTASSARGDAEATNCHTQQISAATRQNKATTFPPTSSKIKADIIPGVKESSQRTVEKVPFPNQKSLSRDVVNIDLVEEDVVAGPSQKMTTCPPTQRTALLSWGTHVKGGGWL